MSAAGMEERRAARRARKAAAWLAYAGIALLLLALLRWSVNNTCDLWCTISVVLGGAAIGAWGVRQHGLLEAGREVQPHDRRRVGFRQCGEAGDQKRKG